MNHWEIKKLSEIGMIFNGNSINEKVKKEKYTDIDEGVPYIGTKDISYESIINYNNGVKIPFVEKDKFKKAPKNTVLICAEGGSAGRKIAYTDRDVYFGNKLFAFIGNKKIDSKYVFYYYFSSCFQKYFSMEITGVIGGVSMNKFKDIEIPVPSLQEQQQIVAILDGVFTAIDKAKSNTKQNLKNSKDLFENELQRIFSNKGNGWLSIPLGELATFRNGMNYTKSSKGEVIKIAGVKDFKDRFWVPSEDLDSFTIDGKLNEIDILKEGDIIAVRSNGNPELIGRTLLAGNINGKVSHSGFTIRIRLDSNIISPIYLCRYLKTSKTRKELVESGNGVGIRSLNQGSLSSLIIPFPKSLKDQQTIVSKLDALREQTKKLEAVYERKLQDLEELKKSVLQKAFIGELSLNKFVETKNSISTIVKNISPTDLQVGITALAFQRHSQKGETHSFHHVKAEKIVHLVETHLGISLNRNPVKDAAGPNDFPHAKKIESRAKKAGFYNVRKVNDHYEYSEGSQFQKIIDKTKTALNEKSEELIAFIDLIVPMTTQQAEIFATVYAAWNNLLLDGEEITDEAIVYEARENWHKDKLKIDREKFFKAIDWMRKKNVVPQGSGKKVLSKPKK